MQRFKQTLLFGATAIGAFCAGHSYALNTNKESVFEKFGISVSAAKLVTQSDVNMTATPERVSEIMKFGFPGLDNVRSFSDYVLSYDRRNRVPHWVFEQLTRASIAHNENVDRAKCEFKPDVSIHPYFRALNTDYKGSGYDRGHMAAAGNHRLHQKHCEDTFFLSNMAPQVGNGFNRHYWNNLEIHARKLTKIYANVCVCTGPLYLPQKSPDGKKYVKYEVIGHNNVAVPTHFFKVLLCETLDNRFELEAYVLPNQPIKDETPMKVFQVPLESIERAAGLLLFDKIDRTRLIKVNGKEVK